MALATALMLLGIILSKTTIATINKAINTHWLVIPPFQSPVSVATASTLNATIGKNAPTQINLFFPFAEINSFIIHTISDKLATPCIINQ